MSVRFNHTIVWCRDQQRSATFLADILGLAAPIRFGPFLVVTLDDGASLDFDQVEGDIAFQHYAFLIDEDDFDAIFSRIGERRLQYWADPGKKRASEIYRHNGGRGFYFESPDGHLLEVLTKPYAIGS
ncbi:MAG TPA: VOC family protein [Burkholderiaceae bacterium]|nr:VOC family protein [Burkholderiaceae bacterium]